MTRDASDFAEDMFKETATKRGRKRATKTQADADADAEATPGTPASRRRRRAAVVVDDDDDEEEDEDDDQDENDEDASLPGLRSAGVTTSKKRAVNSAQKAAKPASKKRLKF
jgi:cohesin loading factor subunit SCC2